MRKLAALLVALTPAIAGADHTITKGSSWDCGKDPIVKLGRGKLKLKLTGECKAIHVGSAKNVLDIESVDELHVTGGMNTIVVGTIAAIDLGGAKNVVRWKKAKSGDKPTVHDGAAGNAVLQAK